jgi:hypothetical protein
MKFGLAIEKKNRGNIGTVEGHNNRLHQTASQLPKEAWITPQGRHEIMPFNADLVAQSKALAKRKDAVLAVELVIQVGNQTDWRDMPTAENLHGKRKPGASKKLNAIMAGVKEAAFAEFGKDRIISIDLHTDESTPHAHIVFAPIVDGKLQAKHWLNGVASCAALRERLHGHVNKFIECDYEKGAPGGAPHDPSKAAGGPAAPKPKPSMLEKASDLLSKSSEIQALKQVISGLNQQLQTMFSRLKKAEKTAVDEAEKCKISEEKAAAADLSERKARREIVVLQREIARLAPYAPEVVKKPLKSGSSGLPERVESPLNTAHHQKPR